MAGGNEFQIFTFTVFFINLGERDTVPVRYVGNYTQEMELGGYWSFYFFNIDL